MTVAEKLKRARGRKELDQIRLAELLGVSQSTISQWESGTCKPKPHRIEAIREVLGLRLTLRELVEAA